jgi:hypothetical protein
MSIQYRSVPSETTKPLFPEDPLTHKSRTILKRDPVGFAARQKLHCLSICKRLPPSPSSAYCSYAGSRRQTKRIQRRSRDCWVVFW